jgi:hypothetical protein
LKGRPAYLNQVNLENLANRGSDDQVNPENPMNQGSDNFDLTTGGRPQPCAAEGRVKPLLSCDRMVNSALDALELIVEAIYAKNRADRLRRINLSMEKLRSLMQISQHKRYISVKQVEYISREINEAGSMVGGWLKKCADQEISGNLKDKLILFENLYAAFIKAFRVSKNCKALDRNCCAI